MIKKYLLSILTNSFKHAGFPCYTLRIEKCRQAELGDFQCSSALTMAKHYNIKPIAIAQMVASHLNENCNEFNAQVSGPGFINIKVHDKIIAQCLNSFKPGALKAKQEDHFVIDFGGPNIAKAMHVGHLRSAIIGDSLQRLALANGFKVTSDVHMGDWGLPIGMLIKQLKIEQPDLIYFKPEAELPSSYPKESPVSILDLERMYPIAAAKANEDEDFRLECSAITAKLQHYYPPYLALWHHFSKISIKVLKKNFKELGVTFDLWLGESNVNQLSQSLIKELLAKNIAKKDDGAIIISLANQKEKAELPPLILIKQDGGLTYSTTDLATIAMRFSKYGKNLKILYIVDQRQHGHFQQVFHAASLSNICDYKALEHIGFGTMNGTDGKPYKTRKGGVMKLSELVSVVSDCARTQINKLRSVPTIKLLEKEEIVKLVTLASIKFADLSNYRLTNYIFDPAKFTRFEGKTGAYMLYSCVRIKSILRKASDLGLTSGKIVTPLKNEERSLILLLLDLENILEAAWEQRAPNILCDYIYNISQTFNNFYHTTSVLKAEPKVSQSRLLILSTTISCLEFVLNILGIQVPEHM